MLPRATRDVPDRPAGIPGEDQTDKILQRIDFEALRQKMSTRLFSSPKNAKTLESLASLTIKLRDRLPYYDTIIGDDASGRLVANLFRNIIKHEREALGKKPPQTFYIAGGTNVKYGDNENVNKFLSQKSDQLGRTLLVTEVMTTGGGIKPIVDTLERNGVKFDLAVVSIFEEPGYYDASIRNHLYYGTVGYDGLVFYRTHAYSGVTKEGIGLDAVHTIRSPFALPDRMIKVRADIHVIADEFIKILETIAPEAKQGKPFVLPGTIHYSNE